MHLHKKKLHTLQKLQNVVITIAHDSQAQASITRIVHFCHTSDEKVKKAERFALLMIEFMNWVDAGVYLHYQSPVVNSADDSFCERTVNF